MPSCQASTQAALISGGSDGPLALVGICRAGTGDGSLAATPGPLEAAFPAAPVGGEAGRRPGKGQSVSSGGVTVSIWALPLAGAAGRKQRSRRQTRAADQ